MNGHPVFHSQLWPFCLVGLTQFYSQATFVSLWLKQWWVIAALWGDGVGECCSVVKYTWMETSGTFQLEAALGNFFSRSLCVQLLCGLVPRLNCCIVKSGRECKFTRTRLTSYSIQLSQWQCSLNLLWSCRREQSNGNSQFEAEVQWECLLTAKNS